MSTVHNIPHLHAKIHPRWRIPPSSLVKRESTRPKQCGVEWKPAAFQFRYIGGWVAVIAAIRIIIVNECLAIRIIRSRYTSTSTIYAFRHYPLLLFLSCPNSQQAKKIKNEKQYPTKGAWEHDPYDHVNPNQWLMKHHLYFYIFIYGKSYKKVRHHPQPPRPFPFLMYPFHMP